MLTTVSNCKHKVGVFCFSTHAPILSHLWQECLIAKKKTFLLLFSQEKFQNISNRSRSSIKWKLTPLESLKSMAAWFGSRNESDALWGIIGPTLCLRPGSKDLCLRWAPEKLKDNCVKTFSVVADLALPKMKSCGTFWEKCCFEVVCYLWCGDLWGKVVCVVIRVLSGRWFICYLC